MATNYIKKYLSKDTAISEIKLLLGADIEKIKIIVVVEGEDDTSFLSKFFREHVILVESYSGKQGVEDIINTQEIYDNRVIGVRDKDYCDRPSNERIFFYDRCCLEMMIIENAESFISICSEYYKGELRADKLKEHILKELYKLSMLRKYNEENNKSINFKGLSFQNFIDNENRLNEDNLKKCITKINADPIDFDCLSEVPRDYSIEDFLNITNGHDFVNFFKVISDKMNNKMPSSKQISTNLRVSYNRASFLKTDIYESINVYFNNKVWE